MLCSKIGNPQRGFAQGMRSGEDILRIPMARVHMQLVGTAESTDSSKNGNEILKEKR